MGLVVIAEPIGYIIYLTLAGGVFEHEIVGYYFVVFVMEVFLLLVVELFCKIKAGKNVRVSLLPKEIAYTLELIPFASVVSCFLLIEIAGEIMSADTMILCMCVIFSIVVTNYIVFLMVHKYTGMAEKRLEEEMIYQTSVYKGYKQDKIEMRGDRAEMSDFPLYLNTVAGGLDRRDQTIGGFSFVVKIYAVPVVEIIG